MYMGHYYRDIDQSIASIEDKKTLKNFLERLEKQAQHQLIGLTYKELSSIFEIAKFNPSLQIEIWRMLPEEVVNNVENLRIFESVLENKFGEYIHEIDKKSLVELLNRSRFRTRSNG